MQLTSTSRHCFVPMAALCPSHPLYSRIHSITELRNRNHCRFFKLLACRGQEPEEKGSKKERKPLLFSQIFLGVEKLGKGLKERLSPKQKGDWKDLVLMSLSFAVYVYISQQMVCAYFAWTLIPKHSW